MRRCARDWSLDFARFLAFYRRDPDACTVDQFIDLLDHIAVVQSLSDKDGGQMASMAKMQAELNAYADFGITIG